MSLIFAKIEGTHMASQEKKGKFNTKLLTAIIIIIIVVSLSVVAAQYALTKPAATNGNLPAMTLTLVGSDGTTKTLTETDIAALQAYTAQGASRSGGKVGAIATYTGVPVTDLLNLVGGMSAGQTLTVTAQDAYTNVYNYNQVVNGQDFHTYTSDGTSTTATQPLKLVVIYFREGAALGNDEGPLKIGVLSSEGLATDGNQWVKMAVKLTVNPAATPAPSTSPTKSPQPTATAKPTAPPTFEPYYSATASPTPSPSVTIADTQVTVTGADGTSKTFNKVDLLALTMTSGLGGKYRSDKGIFDYGTYQGVSISTLLDSVGGMTSSQVLSVVAADGYVKNFTYAQVQGNDLAMYDPATITATKPAYSVTTILAYALNSTSTNLPSYNNDGTHYLMISFVGADGYATIANQFAKYVTEIHVYNS
jgi:hypothetical protein